MADRCAAIILAAGRGTRMGPGQDKLFINLNGLPIVGHTWRRFDQSGLFQHLVLVVREGMQPAFQELADQLKIETPFSFTRGGEERQDSVWNGLEAIPEGIDLVAIQDGARPLTSPATIDECLREAASTGAAVTACRVNDTIKTCDAEGYVQKTLDRTSLRAVQTPQCFQLSIIRAAIREAQRRGLKLTDDTAACELIQQPIKLVLTDLPNPKATSPSDIPLLAQLSQQIKGATD